MPQNLSNLAYETTDIIESLVTEDDEPVDNLFSAKQQRLLVESLYSSWNPTDLETDEEKKISRIPTSVYFFPYIGRRSCRICF